MHNFLLCFVATWNKYFANVKHELNYSLFSYLACFDIVVEHGQIGEVSDMFGLLWDSEPVEVLEDGVMW